MCMFGHIACLTPAILFPPCYLLKTARRARGRTCLTAPFPHRRWTARPSARRARRQRWRSHCRRHWGHSVSDGRWFRRLRWRGWGKGAGWAVLRVAILRVVWGERGATDEAGAPLRRIFSSSRLSVLEVSSQIEQVDWEREEENLLYRKQSRARASSNSRRTPATARPIRPPNRAASLPPPVRSAPGRARRMAMISGPGKSWNAPSAAAGRRRRRRSFCGLSLPPIERRFGGRHELFRRLWSAAKKIFRTAEGIRRRQAREERRTGKSSVDRQKKRGGQETGQPREPNGRIAKAAETR